MMTEDGPPPANLRDPADHPRAPRRPPRPPRARGARRNRASIRDRQGVLARSSRRPSPEEDRASLSARLMTLVRKDFIEPGALDLPGGGRLPVPARAHPRRRVSGDPKETRADLHERSADWLERTAASRRASSTRSSATTSSRRSATGGTGPDRRRCRQLATRAGERLGAAGRRAIVAAATRSGGQPALPGGRAPSGGSPLQA